MPEADDALDYFRCITGEHPDWDEKRAAMRHQLHQGKSLIRITIERRDPVATGGFPALIHSSYADPSRLSASRGMLGP